MRQEITYRGYCGVNLLGGIPVKFVVRSTVVISGDSDSIGITEEEQMAFFRSTQHPLQHSREVTRVGSRELAH